MLPDLSRCIKVKNQPFFSLKSATLSHARLEKVGVSATEYPYVYIYAAPI